LGWFVDPKCDEARMVTGIWSHLFLYEFVTNFGSWSLMD
jgi:hypothetical protein